MFISSADTKERQAKLVAFVEGLTAGDLQPVPALFSSLGQEITCPITYKIYVMSLKYNHLQKKIIH